MTWKADGQRGGGMRRWRDERRERRGGGGKEGRRDERTEGWMWLSETGRGESEGRQRPRDSCSSSSSRDDDTGSQLNKPPPHISRSSAPYSLNAD